MAQWRDALASKAGRVVMSALLLLGLVTITPLFSGAASAHKASVSAEVACDGTVTWTAHSWSSDSKGSNPDVRVLEHTNGNDTNGNDTEVGKGSFGGSQGYQFSGHFPWPAGASTVVVSTKPIGEWGSGHETDDTDQVELVKPADCDHHPEVGKVAECEDSAPGSGSGVVYFTLTNPAGPFGHTANFEVDSPDHTGSSTTGSNTTGSSTTARHTTYHVPAGGNEKLSFHDLADGHHTVHMKVDDQDMSEDFEIQCDQPVPSVTKSSACIAGDGSITVNLANTGGAVATFTVEDPISHHVETITLQPNQSASRTFSGLADGRYTVKVMAVRMMAGDVDLSQYFRVKCDKVDVPPPNVCPTVEQNRYDSHTSIEGTTSSVSEGPSTSADESSSTTDESSSTVDDHHCEPPPAEGTIEVSKACVDHDGQVTITLIASGKQGSRPVMFTVNGVAYSVEPGSSKQVLLGGLNDGTHTVHVMAGSRDLSFDVTINCDLSPRVTVTQACVAFDGSVSLLLENLGDDVDATFTINGVDHVVAPGASDTVVIAGLPDGPSTITLSINGMALPDVVVNFSCNPVFQVKAECNAVSHTGTVDVYWYTVTNTESTDVEVSWDAGTATVPAGQSRTIGSHSATLSLTYKGDVIATAAASDATCTRTVTFQKELIGKPLAPETYTITVSRLVGDAFVPEITFDLVAGTPKTITLPSTLDRAGIPYKVVEVGRGTANTGVVTPDALTLSGHLGETVSVVITNGYASVSIIKTSSDAQVGVGGQVSYSLTAANTNGLTLHPTVVYDRLPAEVSFVSAVVAGGAGGCVLEQTAHPQLVACTMNAALVAGASTPKITVTVTVDTLTQVGATLVNQAKVVGAFGPAARNIEPAGAALSCLPAIDGTVCALSAKVSTSVVEVLPPVPSTTTPPSGPSTTIVAQGGPIPSGGNDPWGLVLIGGGFLGIGGALIVSRRRAASH